MLAALPYLPAITHPLIWDARVAALEDPTIRRVGNIPAFFSSSGGLPNEYPTTQGPNLRSYRPVSRSVLALEYAAFGQEPRGYHVVSLLLNSVVVVLFYLVVAAVHGAGSLALLSAALYAMNPSRVEAVHWVYSDSTQLAAAFCLLSVLAFLRERRREALLAFAVALLCREDAVLLVPVLGLAAWLRLGVPAGGPRLARVAPLAAVAAAFLALRRLVVGHLPPLADRPLFELVPAWAVVVKRSLKLVVLPDAPVAHYPAETFAALAPEALAGYAVCAAVAVLAVVLFRGAPVSLFWLGWTILWFSLALNVGGAGGYLMTEKQMYLACGGAAVLAVQAAQRTRWGGVLVGAACVVHGALVLQRAPFWADERVHLEAVVRFAPGLTLARYDLALALAREGRYADAGRELEEVARRWPAHSPTLNNLGNCYHALRDLPRAESAWVRALRADPANPLPAYNLGMLAERRGDTAEALRYYDAYLARAPDAPPDIVARIVSLRARRPR